jgi:hypothetical protein
MTEMGWLEIIGWMMAAVVKFLVTPTAMVAAGVPWYEVWSVSTLGAAGGVALFWNFGKWLFSWWEGMRGPKDERGKKVFTPSRRRFVRLKNKAGLVGLMAVSGLISVPVATMLAAKYFRDVPWAMARMMLAFGLWAGCLTFISVWIKSLAA